jgi:hypothetical protein
MGLVFTAPISEWGSHSRNGTNIRAWRRAYLNVHSAFVRGLVLGFLSSKFLTPRTFQDADKASMASNVQQAPFIKQLAANGMCMIFLCYDRGSYIFVASR